MKLRIHADSIRLRLKQSEVKSVVEGGEVVVSCPTLPVAITCTLRSVSGIDAMSAECDGARLTLHVPAQWLTGWDTDSRVGFDGQAGPIRLLIEKDWKCANPADPRDNEDCYENPVEC